MRKRPEVGTAIDVRAHLVGALERSNAHWGHLRANEEYPPELTETEKDARRATSIFGCQISRLLADEPVEVFGFALPQLPQPVFPNTRYRVEANGTVTTLGSRR